MLKPSTKAYVVEINQIQICSPQWPTFCQPPPKIRTHFCSYHWIWEKDKHCSDNLKDEDDEHNDEKLQMKAKKDRQIKTVEYIWLYIYIQKNWEQYFKYNTWQIFKYIWHLRPRESSFFSSEYRKSQSSPSERRCRLQQSASGPPLTGSWGL